MPKRTRQDDTDADQLWAQYIDGDREDYQLRNALVEVYLPLVARVVSGFVKKQDSCRRTL